MDDSVVSCPSKCNITFLFPWVRGIHLYPITRCFQPHQWQETENKQRTLHQGKNNFYYFLIFFFMYNIFTRLEIPLSFNSSGRCLIWNNPQTLCIAATSANSWGFPPAQQGFLFMLSYKDFPFARFPFNPPPHEALLVDAVTAAEQHVLSCAVWEPPW